jgi:flagellin-like protein
VSPVVGVALLIAITVILAAVIGFVVLDTSSDTTDTSNAQLDFAYSDATNSLTVTHEGGDTFNATDVVIRDSQGNETQLDDIIGTGDFNTGNSFTIKNGTGTLANVTSGVRYTVVWDDPESDRENQIASTTIE